METKRIKVEVEIEEELFDLINSKVSLSPDLNYQFSDALNLVLYEGQEGIWEAQQYLSEKVKKQYRAKANIIYDKFINKWLKKKEIMENGDIQKKQKV